VKWVEELMVRHVAGLPSLEPRVRVPELPRSVLAPGEMLASPFSTYVHRGPEPHYREVEPYDTVTRWLYDALGHEYGTVLYEWYQARVGWPLRQLWRAYEREADALHARAACRVSAIASAQIEGNGTARITADLLPRPLPARRVRVWLGMPSAYTCDCQPPVHARGIARCDWNDIRGWRPRPRQYEETDGNG
jgi:hypothetical protein